MVDILKERSISYNSRISGNNYVLIKPLSATGGTVNTNANGYTTHTFLANGTFTVSALGSTATSSYAGLTGTQIQILAVAGGGGAGVTNGGNGGGGGAGGLVYTISTVAAATYTITIGLGGIGGNSSTQAAASGTNTSIIGTGISITAIGGGAGATQLTTRFTSWFGHGRL